MKSRVFQTLPNVLLAPKDLLNRLAPVRYPVEEFAATHDMLSQDLINCLTSLVFGSYDASTPRGFATYLQGTVQKFLVSRGHKVKRVSTLYGRRRVTIAIITNGGAKTFEFTKHEHYGLMYSSCDGISKQMTAMLKITACPR
jgi:hypothetical protein